MDKQQDASANGTQGAFERIADFMSCSIGTPFAFGAALAVIIGWATLGPVAGFSNTWQLVINTGTTVVTFLMVFLLGNASNRITATQDRLLKGILGEEERLETEDRMMRKLLERMDVKHIRPILNHLDEQDHQMEDVAGKILEEIRQYHPAGS
jgi:low affinity Fe/Cu permease